MSNIINICMTFEQLQLYHNMTPFWPSVILNFSSAILYIHEAVGSNEI